ncbi:hypothetical protein HK099_008343 [Clydaea vesicula]|uniref:Uncharacterized protein n=1 Tax=Clydaea vesicula TaxID=447962 RepID=A0AAD5XVX1_9FUNG|nr:hypothetical protein HK099_008343 [Clydaea vesicula]
MIFIQISALLTFDVTNPNTFTVQITDIALSGSTGGGPSVKVGTLASYQFLFGNYSDTIADVLGFPIENSSVNRIVGKTTFLVAEDHGLQVNDRIKLYNFNVQPSIYTNLEHQGENEVYSEVSPDVFSIRCYTERVSDISNYQVLITTLFPHGLITGDNIRLNNTNSVPPINGYYLNITVIGLDQFIVSNFIDPLQPNILPLTITHSGFHGILNANQKFYLYNVEPVGGFTNTDLNSVPFNFREVIDENNFIFTGMYGFSLKLNLEVDQI